MKQMLIKDDVATALTELSKNGKKPTLVALRAALGNRGSITTLVKLKRELESAAQEVAYSEDALQAFKGVWNMAYEEGRRQQQIVTANLQENIQALAVENERLEAATAAAECRSIELERAKSAAQTEMFESRAKLERELSQAQAALAQANAQAAKALENLAAVQSAHAAEISVLQRRINEMTQQVHEQELKRVRAESILESQRTKGNANA